MAIKQRRTVHYITVGGRGEFPLDMLTYDCCYPLTADDLAKLLPRYANAEPKDREALQYREVSLGCVRDNGPTIGRWESFAWKIVQQAR